MQTPVFMGILKAIGNTNSLRKNKKVFKQSAIQHKLRPVQKDVS